TSLLEKGTYGACRPARSPQVSVQRSLQGFRRDRAQYITIEILKSADKHRRPHRPDKARHPARHLSMYTECLKTPSRPRPASRTASLLICQPAMIKCDTASVGERGGSLRAREGSAERLLTGADTDYSSPAVPVARGKRSRAAGLWRLRRCW